MTLCSTQLTVNNSFSPISGKTFIPKIIVSVQYLHKYDSQNQTIGWAKGIYHA